MPSLLIELKDDNHKVFGVTSLSNFNRKPLYNLKNIKFGVRS